MDWYEVVDEDSLSQGDVITGCPVLVAPSDLEGAEGDPLEVDLETVNAVILTQSCDLTHEKVTEILLAQVLPWADARDAEVRAGNESARSRRFRENLVAGNLPGLSLLHKHDAEPELPWSVVTFHRLFTIDKERLSRHVHRMGPRLRLRSPYKEHLAQAFARYFMRVGLPHEAREFITEGAA